MDRRTRCRSKDRSMLCVARVKMHRGSPNSARVTLLWPCPWGKSVLKSRTWNITCIIYYQIDIKRPRGIHVWSLAELIGHFTLEIKKRSEETQTLRAGCSKGEPKTFAQLQTPFPGAQDGQNLISWRWSLPLPTNPVWWGSMHAISTFRGNIPTNTHTNKLTHRQDRLQYTAPLSLVRGVMKSTFEITHYLVREIPGKFFW